MTWAKILREQIHLNTSQILSSAELHKMVADECRKNRDDAIAAGRASPTYETYVDGRKGGREEDVMLQGGVVSYVFSNLATAANWALSECRRRSPVSSGAYRKSWIILVNGEQYPELDTIPSDQTVMIVNTMPYARKIEVGGMRIRVPPGIIESVRRPVMSRFPGVTATRAFLPMSGGRDARGGPVPYILKQAGIASGISWDKKAKSWGRKHSAYVSERADRQAGQQMLYPTLILKEG